MHSVATKTEVEECNFVNKWGGIFSTHVNQTYDLYK